MQKLNDVTSYNLRDFIDRSEYTKVNQLRISKANSLEHELKKAEIFTKLIHSGHDVLTEAKFLQDKSFQRSGVKMFHQSIGKSYDPRDRIGRADVLVLDIIPMKAYEIVSSESVESIERKKNSYPCEIVVVKI